MMAPGITSLALHSGSADHTRAIGRALARRLRAGDVLLLHGDLGAGKTTLAQGIGEGLLVRGAVQSPTFVLVDEHEPAAGGLALNHVDLYRLDRPEDVAAIGFDEYLDPAGGVTIVEWPERAGDLLPDAYLLVELHQAGDGRSIVLAPHADATTADRWLAGLAEAIED